MRQFMVNCVFVLVTCGALSAIELARVKRVQDEPVHFYFFVFSATVGTARLLLFFMEVNNTRVTIEVFAFGTLLRLLDYAQANRADKVVFEWRRCCVFRIDIQQNT